MNLELVKKTLDLIENFENQTGHSSFPQFLNWLNIERVSSDFLPDEHKEPANFNIAFHALLLGRKMQQLTYNDLQDTGLLNLDEFSFLMHLEHLGEIKKSTLIPMHFLSYPTGIEVINRLIKKEMILQKTKPEDKRAKFISITLKGEKALKKAQRKINKSLNNFLDGLKQKETIMLSYLLQKAFS